MKLKTSSGNVATEIFNAIARRVFGKVKFSLDARCMVFALDLVRAQGFFGKCKHAPIESYEYMLRVRMQQTIYARSIVFVATGRDGFDAKNGWKFRDRHDFRSRECCMFQSLFSWRSSKNSSHIEYRISTSFGRGSIAAMAPPSAKKRKKDVESSSSHLRQAFFGHSKSLDGRSDTRLRVVLSGTVGT